MQRIHISASKKKKLMGILGRYTSYKKFSRSRNDAFEYAASLGVRVCPYCNIFYTYTVYDRHNSDGSAAEDSIPVYRPDFDHFTSQSAAPGLTREHENLIPSCQKCNSRIKLRKIFHVSTHIHPFLDDFDSIKRFTVDLKSPDYLDRKNFSIGFADRTSNTGDTVRADNTIRDLRLIPRYQYHKEDVVDVFRKAKYYHRHRLREIGELVGNQGLNLVELRRHLFLSDMKPINEAPLSKLRRDALEAILR